jgi:flavin reductase (DIM6/NTAB) family NADH-FMN oxidoreductase RutF
MTDPIRAGVSDLFKHAMRRLASTVTIVTAEHEGLRYGMVATAVCSLGVDPPSLIASVAETASLHDPLLANGRFCVNLLTQSQADLVSVFSGQHSGEARFQFGSWERHELGPPLLRKAQANLICHVVATLRYSGHTVFVGRVIDVHAAEAIVPLLYHNGSIAAARPI